LKAVLDAGFHVDQKMPHDYNGKIEYMIALFWALSLPEGTIEESILETLIIHQGDSSNKMND
jgi:hypothetical protein